MHKYMTQVQIRNYILINAFPLLHTFEFEMGEE